MPRFPLDVAVPSFDATGGMRQFGARREGGARLHAGCDLYARPGTPIRAIARGFFSLRRDFYEGTDQLVVHHPGIGVVRYGEVMKREHYARHRVDLQAALGEDAPTSPPTFEAGAEIQEGDVIAHVGDLKGITASMLHFELYEESAKGESLGGHGGRYGRHPGLLDPTQLLEALRRDGRVVPGLRPTGLMTFPKGATPRGRTKGVAGASGPVLFPDRRAPRRDELVFARLAPNEPQSPRSASWDDAANLYRSTWRT